VPFVNELNVVPAWYVILSFEYVNPAPEPPLALLTKIDPSVEPKHVGFVPVALTETAVGCVTVAFVLPTSPKLSLAYIV
jgi:hypothetical protein